ncbi:MAG: hypothetical protein RR891_07475 [Clostridium sp.]
MNKIQAMEHLEKLKADCEEFTSIETKEEDLEALVVAIAALEETNQGAPVQEQSKKDDKDRYTQGLRMADEKISEYLLKFPKQVHPTNSLWFIEKGEGVAQIGEEIIKTLKEKELTYVDAYATLEYVYRYLKFMSEYTHL